MPKETSQNQWGFKKAPLQLVGTVFHYVSDVSQTGLCNNGNIFLKLYAGEFPLKGIDKKTRSVYFLSEITGKVLHTGPELEAS